MSAGRPNTEQELVRDFLNEHLDYYLALLEKIVSEGKFGVTKIKVAISNTRILEELAKKLNLDTEKLKHEEYDVNTPIFSKHNIDLPTKISITSSEVTISDDKLELLGITKPLRYLRNLTSVILEKLKQKYPYVEFEYDLQRAAGVGYYDGLCFKISAQNYAGEWYPLCDGGFTDWTKQLSHSEKETCLVSCFGSELFIGKFKRT